MRSLRPNSLARSKRKHLIPGSLDPLVRLRGRRGFSLIEAIACIVMLSIAIPPMLWAVREAHAKRVGPVMASKARWLAMEKLEDVIADRNSPTRGYDYLAAGNYPMESSITNFAGFTRSVSFNETGSDLASAGTGFITVNVTISWSDGSAPRSLAVSTVLTEF